ncbi:hypothetical protein C8R43DRAFT_1144593 [Mycena crocata]|nr:hypothetical protein C8R43DRAFT_1144593 [Mycena crocata]
MSGSKKRAAATSARAKRAAAVAVAESKDAENDAPPPRKRGRPPKQKDTSALEKDEGNASEGEEEDKKGTGAGILIDWNGDFPLTWSLVSAIEDDEETRSSLFPPPGSHRHSGGLPKKHYHSALARTLFAKHAIYGEAFKKATKPKEKDFWSDKIKNRLKTITEKTKAQITIMGETGAGVESEEDLLPGTALTTKWDGFKEEAPWFWHMRSLIGERPNLRPVGIGNNSSDVDTSFFLPGTDDDGGTGPSSPDGAEDFPEHIADVNLDLYNPVDNKMKTPKRKTSPSASAQPAAKKTKPAPATPAPAPAASKACPVKLAKPSTTKDKFNAAIAAEEETAQKALDLRKEKTKSRKDVVIAKIEALAKVKLEKTRMKGKQSLARMEYARIKLEQEHQLRMAQLQQSSHAGPSSMGSSSVFGNSDTFSLPHLPSFPSSDGGSSSGAMSFGYGGDDHSLVSQNYDRTY